MLLFDLFIDSKNHLDELIVVKLSGEFGLNDLNSCPCLQLFVFGFVLAQVFIEVERDLFGILLHLTMIYLYFVFGLFYDAVIFFTGSIIF